MLDDRDHDAIALSDVLSPYEAFRPPKRVSVSEGVRETLVIKNTGGPATPWSADETPYMVEPMDMLASRRHEAVCFVGPARTGKCLDVTTPIPTPDGWTTMGELRAGDVVFGTDGQPTRVEVAHPVLTDLPCYEVEFSDGSTLVADSEHLWGVERFYWKEPNWRYEVRSTASMLDDFRYSMRVNGRGRFRYRVRNAQPIELPPKNLLIDPYLLGAWLGNGATNGAKLSSHKDDAPHYEAAILQAGYAVRSVPEKGNVVSTFIDPNGVSDSVFGSFREQLKCLNLLGDKHIPKEYLRGSLEQRLALLRGLMDTDGYAGVADHVGVEFSTTTDALKDGVMELARSIGLRPRATEKISTWVYKGERKFGTAWRVTFLPDGIEVFTLARKRSKCPHAEIDIGFRQIVDIRPVESRPVRCIKVAAANSLFLAGEGYVPTHNTAALVLGLLAHAVVNDPGDMLVIQMSQEKARDFSKTDVDRALRYSPLIAALKSHRSSDDNLHDKMFRHGMFLKIAWPTIGNVSGSTYRYAVSTDYDRVPDDIDGEGALFPLILKRTQTFMSRGMAMVESSPGREIEDPNWRPSTRHEAPPTKGILGIYNMGDRRRWFWQCPDCDEWFEAEPGMGLFGLPPDDQLLTLVREANLDALAGEYNRIICPHCGVMHGPKKKSALNAGGRWVADGQRLRADGTLDGDATVSPVASFWMGGVAAAFQSWKSLLMRHFQGLRQYDLTGDEEALKNTVNLDQGMPYMSRRLVEAAKASRSPSDRLDGTLTRYVVPGWVRFLGTTVDVQKGRFVVQVHGFGPRGEKVIVDRFNLTESRREALGGGFAEIDPSAVAEDWDMLTEKVVRATYRTEVEGREMRVMHTMVDSGGEDGVTDKAYAWYRRLRRERLHGQVTLVKGANNGLPGTPIKETWVGARNPREKGDVPMYLLDTNRLKDIVDKGLKRHDPGPGYTHLPEWLSKAALDELQAEVREANGKWKQIRKRNETFDLLAYAEALYIRLGADKIGDWNTAPPWAAPQDVNSQMVTREERREESASVRLQTSPPAQQPMLAPRRRRASVSSYVRG